jgi:7,8-dihydropterin-6-yl-methyl-4-(beta-D-ribofuranosyl)aminobenzene 5'-phosphate synthase
MPHAHREASTLLSPVDRIDIQVLVDNVTDQLSTNPSGVQSEFAALMRAGMTTIAGEAICSAHHGLSLVVTAHRGDRARTMLFDTGPEGYAIERNGARLGVDFGAVEAVVLSHGHWDHCGGALTALGLIGSRRRGSPATVYSHPGMYRRRARRLPDGRVMPFKAIPTASEMGAAGAEVIVTEEPRVLLDDGLFVSGEIPRITTYERGLPDHLWQPAESSSWEPDPLILDERFVAAHVKDKGLVVMTGCSHAGVVNVLAHARAVFPGIPLFAVVGGLHLSGAGPERIIGDTLKDLADFDLRRIVPAHCTGWRAVTALVTTFGEKGVVPSAVGKRFSF